MTLVVRGDAFVIEQVIKQLHKLIDVIKVTDLSEEDHVEREMILIKVNAEPPARAEILRIGDIFRAKVVDVTPTTYTLEVTGDEAKIEAIIELLRPFGIQELVRTGKVAIARGPKTRLRKVPERLGKPAPAGRARRTEDPQGGRVRGLTSTKERTSTCRPRSTTTRTPTSACSRGKKIAIIGYGSQGHAHALNLKDSGQDVVVGLYKGSKSWAAAEKDGLKVMSVNDAAAAGDIVMILLPDQTQRQVYEESIKGALGKGKTLMFAHGFNIHFNQVVPAPDVDVSMIAPKAPGHVMRDLFTQGPGVPGPGRGVPGRVRQGARHGPRLRQGRRAARAPASSRPRSRRRRRPTCSASRPRCAAASRT